MQNITCGVASVIIGREFSLQPLLSYFKTLEVPSHIFNLNLYLIIGCDSKFEKLLRDKIKELELSSKYDNIYFIPGNLKCYPELNWNEWESFTRNEDPDLKHRSALDNINIALESTKNETYIHFVDDDTIPPKNALKYLLKTYQGIDNCGLSSGIYFNKQWVEPTIAVSEIEAERRIVGSYKKEKWLGCSIDDLAIENYQDIGFVGNGCMLVSGEDIKKILPLTEFREQNDHIAPPDFIICRRIRRLNKVISISPQVIAHHLDQNGNPVGLGVDYLEKVKNSTGSNKILIIHYNKYFNYSKLSKQFDKILVLNHIEINSKSISHLNRYENIKVIERSIVKTCEKYDNYKNYSTIKGESRFYVILEEIHKFIKNCHNYVVYIEHNNSFVKFPLLDSTNLKKLLNRKI